MAVTAWTETVGGVLYSLTWDGTTLTAAQGSSPVASLSGAALGGQDPYAAAARLLASVSAPLPVSAGGTGQSTLQGVLQAFGIDTLGYSAPAGAIAETFSRDLASNSAASSVVSGQATLNNIGLPAGVTVSSISMSTDVTPATGLTHGWYALADQNLKVLGVTADQTSVTWTAASTEYKLPLTAPVTTAYTGLYFVAVCVTATGAPTLCSVGAVRAPLANIAPAFMGQSGTGLTTPPAVGSTLAALTPGGTRGFYAYVS